MKRYEAVSDRVLDTVDVPKGELGDADPVNDAIRAARRADTDYDRRADDVRYEAVDHGPYYRVIVKGVAAGAAQSREGATPEGFQEREWRAVDVEERLRGRHTVAELRELGREHDVSYRRGSTKKELAEQFAEQAPDAAFRLTSGR